MKKLLTFLVAASALCASALTEVTTSSSDNDKIVSPSPKKLIGVYVLNNGAAISKSESVKVCAYYTAQYLRYYPWIDGSGSDSVGIRDRIGVTIRHSSYPFYLKGVINKVGSNDPNAYAGDVSGPFLHDNDDQPVGPLVGKFHIETYTDESGYRTKVISTQENNWQEEYSYPIDASGSGDNAVATLPAYMQNQEIISLASGFSAHFFVAPDTVTNVVSVAQKEHASFRQIEQEFVNMNVGSAGYAITNNLNQVIPAYTKLKVTTNDPQTKVGLIFE